MFRALGDFLRGIGRFLPCTIGGNHCRLRHIGWEQSGHGLSSRPEESADHLLLNALLEIFDYHAGSAQELLAGNLKLRYCKLHLRAGCPLGGFFVLVMLLSLSPSSPLPQGVNVKRWSLS